VFFSEHSVHDVRESDRLTKHCNISATISTVG